MDIINLINKELQRQKDHIELIASENYVSKNVLKATGSILTNKYAEGTPNKRYYGGCEFVDQIESLAIEKLKKLFGAKHANVQPHSGSTANSAAYLALLKPGDKVLAMGLNDGGHLTHGSKVNFSGKIYDFYHYNVDKNTHLLDYDEILKKALEIKPKLIVCGASNYSRFIDFKKFKEIADQVGAYLMADVAHIAGLIVTGYHQNPIPYCDIVTSTTHKTLRGPRGGVILTNKEELIKKIDSAVFPGELGGPLVHVIAAKAIAFEEALQPEFKTYIKNVIDNNKAFCDAFIKKGYKIIANGTDNHLFTIDLFSKFNLTGDLVENWLYEAGIVVNKNTIPYDSNKPTNPSGIRLGTAAMTTRNLDQNDFIQISDWIDQIIKSKGNKDIINKIKKEVKKLLDKHPIYEDLSY
ncbi:serine hydroxymethyltransferase [Mycoplasma bradburyae]|uniref:Serine hydroxymethyltransferase n=1 Tax=Mycoplasma bradburyae TaxID=2963128 RepID=A0AAW6HQ03_9MOLU|nr:serine hydroxymethyltransferase [Mycoplasma bradburyae]MDC4182649.1 serine hydroxymethyltransferase [Mycoplasma bradburyae]MDC4183321.1 serine hydroxymethyltransferase [Mycoplasma bradburyae]MDC4184129.1 serine hydroxymethyltransferase [Mycoplasma bradburyae]UTS71095.1 serine hydroxymethyltransferase [Mycoplasma bradburyae]